MTDGDQELFKDRSGPIPVRAVLLGQRLGAGATETVQMIGEGPIIGRSGSGVAVLLRYGAVVLIGMTSEEEAELLRRLEPSVVGPFAELEEEEAELVVDAGRSVRVSHGVITVGEITVPTVQLIGEVLGRSVALNHYEEAVTREFERIEPWAEGLTEGRRAPPEKQLLSQIGHLLLIAQGMVGRVEVRESPELLWEHGRLERLFVRLKDEYELVERDAALDRKIDQLGRTVELLVGLHQDRRTVRLEVYIVLLIVIEVILYIYDLFLKG